jgi:hypothetical protein
MLDSALCGHFLKSLTAAQRLRRSRLDFPGRRTRCGEFRDLYVSLCATAGSLSFPAANEGTNPMASVEPFLAVQSSGQPPPAPTSSDLVGDRREARRLTDQIGHALTRECLNCNISRSLTQTQAPPASW